MQVLAYFSGGQYPNIQWNQYTHHHTHTYTPAGSYVWTFPLACKAVYSPTNAKPPYVFACDTDNTGIRIPGLDNYSATLTLDKASFAGWMLCLGFPF